MEEINDYYTKRWNPSNNRDKEERRLALYKMDGNKCLKCGERKIDNLTIDHVIPLSMGGGNDFGNMQTLCKTCNTEKGSKAIDYRGGEVKEIDMSYKLNAELTCGQKCEYDFNLPVKSLVTKDVQAYLLPK